MEWRSISEYEGLYEVSDHGQIRNARSRRVLRPADNGHGYLHVCLSKKNKTETRRVHSLVANAFLGLRQEKHQVNHKNLNKHDNCAANLEYITGKENVRHRAAMGPIRRYPPIIRSIAKKTYAFGMSKTSIGRILGVPMKTISKMVAA